MCTQNRLQEQSDLGLHCLPKRPLKHFSRREKQTTFVAIDKLRVNFLRNGNVFSDKIGKENFLEVFLPHTHNKKFDVRY